MKIKEFIFMTEPGSGLVLFILFYILYIITKNPLLLLQGFSLSWPLSFIAHSLNNIYDLSYDKKNKRKERHVKLYSRKNIQKQAISLSIVFSIFIVGISILTRNLQNFILTLIILFLAISYSVPPLRFKSRPFLDVFVTYGLGVFCGYLTAYTYVGDIFKVSKFALLFYIIPAIMGIHNQIKDYESDKKSSQHTTATYMGLLKSKLLIIFMLIILLVFFTDISFLYTIYLIGFIVLSILNLIFDKYNYLIMTIGNTVWIFLFALVAFIYLHLLH